MAIIPTIIALTLLLACSGFLSGSETSLFSLSSLRVRRLQSESKKGRLIASLLAHPRSLLSGRSSLDPDLSADTWPGASALGPFHSHRCAHHLPVRRAR